jgi:hypothetical protein
VAKTLVLTFWRLPSSNNRTNLRGTGRPQHTGSSRKRAGCGAHIVNEQNMCTLHRSRTVYGEHLCTLHLALHTIFTNLPRVLNT